LGAQETTVEPDNRNDGDALPGSKTFRGGVDKSGTWDGFDQHHHNNNRGLDAHAQVHRALARLVWNAPTEVWNALVSEDGWNAQEDWSATNPKEPSAPTIPVEFLFFDCWLSTRNAVVEDLFT
jgi:hypothetical protein